MKTFFLAVNCLFLSIQLNLAQTNQFYITDDRETNFDRFIPTAEQIEKAKSAAESRPAHEDLGDNWGAVTEGFQLSIRLKAVSFAAGQPVKATMFLRNVADKPLKFYVFSPVDDKLKIVLMRNHQPVSPKDAVTPNMTFEERLGHVKIGKPWRATIDPGIQRRFVVELTNIFNLTPGEYEVQAEHEIMNMDQTGKTNVFSGYATFMVK